jgi:hypothetical protein
MVFIPPDVINDANKAADPKLEIPESAVVKGMKGTPRFKANWNELVSIVSATMEDVEDPTKPPGRAVVLVQLQVSPDSPDPLNLGKAIFFRGYINESSLANKGSKEYKMTIISVGKINALLRACGIETSGGVDYDQYFNGDVSPLIGSKLWAVMQHKEANEEYPQEVRNFVSLTDQVNAS